MSKRKGSDKSKMDISPSKESRKSVTEQDTIQEFGDHETSGKAYIWLAAAVAIGLASASYYLSSYLTSGGIPQTPVSVTAVPESYAVCGDTQGIIYTVDDAHPNVDCLLIHKDEIRVAGTADDINTYWEQYQNEVIKKFYGNEPKAKKSLSTVHLKPGSIIVPGLADAHAHLLLYGFKVQLPLDNAGSLEEILDILEDYVNEHPELLEDPNTWVEGMGWDQTRWKDWSGEFPTAAHLASRKSLESLPISLSRVDGHALWVSPRVLELTKEQLPGQKWPSSEEVNGGEIVRDSTGNPTGVFVDNAMSLVHAPAWSFERRSSYLETATQDALKYGLTSVHDAGSTLDFIEVFQSFAEEGQLPIRIYAMGNSDNTSYWGDSIPRLEDYGQDERLNLKSVKLYTDGALGSWGAALLEPYSDRPDTSGIMRISPESLEDLVKKFWEDGWGINIHCIGDRANKVVLDVFETVLTEESEKTGEDIQAVAARRRPRIEHAQIMREGDLQRAGRLGVITSVQPTHATSDMWYAETRLGPKRIKGAYAYQTLLQSSPNKILPLGSDFPVEGINPLLGFYAAVSRLDVHGESPHGSDGWYSSEKLTRAQALKGMTLDAAYAAFAEDRLGSLVPGKKADYVVLNRNIMSEDTPVHEILGTVVQATVVDGRIAYGGI
ncbi:amidohydrolase family-domain-containing protein [Irpex rosettiformis]|uniref:Amidohydrolase family-domain-containing protein n=1 Tax=Irpex rosettiformis TaxID=378272 RepID=A0ACB8TZY9_9APHY|nr:amidohydrolase family-domain-containing protein [Irpex rosettiformis]